ncbi:MAG: acyl carrier protein [Candidatus Pacearchaeota archaeon]
MKRDIRFELKQTICDYINDEELAKGLTPKELDEAKALEDYGIDSLNLLELGIRIEEDHPIDLNLLPHLENQRVGTFLDEVIKLYKENY